MIPFRSQPAHRRGLLAAMLLLTGSMAAQTSWSPRLSIPSHPTAREGFAMAAADPSFFAPAGVIICFGGFDGIRLTDETYFFDIATSTWFALAGGPRPTPREGHAIAYDPLVNAFVLHGGRTTSVVGATGHGNLSLNDTWQFNISNFSWQQLSAQHGGITPRLHDHAMVFDRSRGQMLVFGGHQNSVGGPLLGDEMWLFRDFTGPGQHAWRLDFSATNSPFGRVRHEMVFDERRQRVVMFGGRIGVNLTPTNEFLEFDSSQFGFSAWTNITTTATPSLTPATQPQMAYDVARARVMFFGNAGSTGGSVREFDGTSWVTRGPTPSLQPNGHGFVYDRASRQCVFFSGATANQTHTYGPTTKSDVRNYGFGCGGGGPVPQLRNQSGVEWQLGTTRNLVVSNLASTYPLAATGVSFTEAIPPIPFGGGCSQLIGNPFVTLSTLTTGGASSVVQPTGTIPNDPAFTGFHLFFQTVLFDTNPANPLGLVFSNGVDATVGTM